MGDIVIMLEGFVELGVTFRADRTRTITELLAAVPFSSRAQRWGDEVYFHCPFHSELEGDAREDMDVGEVAFWPEGDAIAVFFGRTPVSTGQRPRAYSPCNIVGRVEGDLGRLAHVQPGCKVEVKKV